MADTGTLTQRTEDDLVAAARAAVTQAFLSREGGTRYGAAALTRSGRVFTSGQYSSYNHVTNVHAEQAVLVKAASAGDADVVALAVASTSDQDLTVPCGVCLQALSEFGDPLIVARVAGEVRVFRLTELLRVPFRRSATAEP